ncbi:mitochondrial carrier domain-containing protein [Polychytrium aggregatum]|uniref:mitochondrial carrier domain-containing protein n=1 Tax=Polychytrium aggregatum TaxID=110093 RepID=UPI0022FDFB81|nr:mitochondrial carrier domain-containing protein [Polychytrium aggregatum]KAI9204210.1 mitochondrial carrier domain-containing protein [Polychytrium aggregatum]
MYPEPISSPSVKTATWYPWAPTTLADSEDQHRSWRLIPHSTASVSPPAEPGTLAVHSEDEPPKRIGLEDMDGSRYLGFGSLFILMVDSFLFPLDTIKTIIMSERGSHKSSGTFRTIARVIKHEGITRFWRGLGPSVAGSFPGQASYYLAYETAQEVSKHILPAAYQGDSSFWRGFISGAWAEVAGGLFYVPADVVSQRLQIQNLAGFHHNSRLFNGPSDVIRKVLRTEGLRGFYRGYFAYVAAYAPGSAVQWGAYEFGKPFIHKGLTLCEHYILPTGHALPHKDNVVNGISGGMASLCAVTANNPLEVIRIRTQLLEKRNKKDAESLRKGFLQLGLQIWRHDGWRGMVHRRGRGTEPSGICGCSSAFADVPSARMHRTCRCGSKRRRRPISAGGGEEEEGNVAASPGLTLLPLAHSLLSGTASPPDGHCPGSDGNDERLRTDQIVVCLSPAGGCRHSCFSLGALGCPSCHAL